MSKEQKVAWSSTGDGSVCGPAFGALGGAMTDVITPVSKVGKKVVKSVEKNQANYSMMCLKK